METSSSRRQLIKTTVAATAGMVLSPIVSAAGVAAQQGRTSDAAATSSTGSHDMMGAMLQDAIAACVSCHAMCLRTATGYCLEQGGRHVEPAHFRLMLNCAELCQTSANFMLSRSEMHARVCLICAEACEACAKSCDRVGDMRECKEECLRCAKSCRSMT